MYSQNTTLILKLHYKGVPLLKIYKENPIGMYLLWLCKHRISLAKS